MRHSLLFYINDQQYEIDDGRAGWTLAEFLRQECRLVATKVVCAEGDCGSCTVLVGRERPGCQTFAYQPIDSCIVFLYQLDRTHVVTVEGLTYDDILSPVQQAMVDCHGSQCGFCTPGFVTALHGMLEEQRAASNGNMSLSDEQLREGLSGNLCRCTGYVQILDAGKQIEPAAVPPLAQRYDPREMLAAFHHLPTEPVHIRARLTIRWKYLCPGDLTRRLISRPGIRQPRWWPEPPMWASCATTVGSNRTSCWPWEA